MQNNVNTNIECKTIKLNTVSGCPQCEVVSKLIGELNHTHPSFAGIKAAFEWVDTTSTSTKAKTNAGQTVKSEPTTTPARKQRVSAKAKSNVQMKGNGRVTSEAKSKGASRRDRKKAMTTKAQRKDCRS